MIHTDTRHDLIGINTTNAVASGSLTAVAMICAFAAFRPHVPALPLQLWAWPTAALLGAWLVAVLVFAIRDPGIAERASVWARIAALLQIWTWLAVLGIIWLLMPHGTLALQFTTMLFSVCYIVASTMSAIEVEIMTRVRVVVTLGSLATVAVIERIEAWPFLLVFLLTFGAFMIALNWVVADGVAAIRIARDEAEAARDARTRFLTSASHDLGQPLQAARLFFDQALRSSDPAQRERAASDARDALGSMERLLRGMLDHLRLEAGTVTVRKSDVAAGSLIGKVASQFAPVAALANVELIAVPSQVFVRGDADLIERALGNLVDNALRHARARRVLIGARKYKRRVRFWVIDDGAGVARSDLLHLFEDYVQGSDHGDAERGGFGLGLASAKRLAALMDGIAGIEVKWLRGSAFFLDLPAGGALASH